MTDEHAVDGVTDDEFSANDARSPIEFSHEYAGMNEPLPELTERQEMILSLIVREYIRDPQPVASKALLNSSILG